MSKRERTQLRHDHFLFPIFSRNIERPVHMHRASALFRSLPRVTSLAAIVGQASERDCSEAIADDLAVIVRRVVEGNERYILPGDRLTSPKAAKEEKPPRVPHGCVNVGFPRGGSTGRTREPQTHYVSSQLLRSAEAGTSLFAAFRLLTCDHYNTVS